MSLIFANLKKKFEQSECVHEENSKFPHNVDLFGTELESRGILTKPLVKCGILILLFRKNNELNVLFTIRSMNLKIFPGEICFPGGKFDPLSDKSLEETAE